MDTIYLARYLVPVISPPIEGGGLLVRRGQIIAIATADDLTAAHPRAAVVDFGDDSILLPPLVNAHTHLELTHFPQWAAEGREAEPPADFVDWILRVIRTKRSIPFESFRDSVAAGIRASLKAGTGAVGDVLSWFPARDVFVNAPLFGRLYLETLGRDPARNRQVLQAIVRIGREVVVGRLRLGLSPHSPYNLSSEYLEDVFNSARRHGLPLMTHVAESAAEVEFLQRARGPIAEKLYPFVGWQDMLPLPAGCAPVRYLADHGGLVAENLLVHGVQVDARDCAAIARAGASVVLCPRSNNRLQVGRAPVEEYLAAGVNLALGTDSLASCDSLSVWDELAFARTWFAGKLTPESLLRMATHNGASALGLAAEMGAFGARMGAHFQVLRATELPPLSELCEYLVSPGRTAEVKALYLAGRDVFFALDSGEEVC